MLTLQLGCLVSSKNVRLNGTAEVANGGVGLPGQEISCGRGPTKYHFSVHESLVFVSILLRKFKETPVSNFRIHQSVSALQLRGVFFGTGTKHPPNLCFTDHQAFTWCSLDVNRNLSGCEVCRLHCWCGCRSPDFCLVAAPFWCLLGFVVNCTMS